MAKKVKPFVKLFEDSVGQVLIVLREGGTMPSISVTIQVPGLGIMDSKFEYEDSDEGYKQARERFAATDEAAAIKIASGMRKSFGGNS